MTVHLTSSVRMGEDTRRAAADSFGRVHGATNLRVNDASLLPDAPGVNPQATIMAIAARNVDQFLAEA
jgi:choline dehydrogenase-like flavoprotein